MKKQQKQQQQQILKQAIPIKLVVVGDSQSNKTKLLIKYSTGSISQYTPNVFDNYCVNLKLDNQFISVGLWDTAGAEQYNRLRPLTYPNSDILIITFSVCERSSFNNAIKKFYVQLKQNIQTHVPIVFIGNSTQKRKKILQQNNENQQIFKKIIMKQQAKQIIQKQLNRRYYQCTLYSDDDQLNNIITQLIRLAVKNKVKPVVKKSKSKMCQII